MSKTDANASAQREARAACGAYLMVAFADGVFDPSEENRFLASLANNAAFKTIPTEILQDEYNALVAAIKSDYRAAASQILEDIAWARGAGIDVGAIKLAAQTAVVADTRLEPQEEAALDEIEKALGLNEGAL